MTNKQTKLINEVCQIAISAGEPIMNIYRHPSLIDIRKKEDDSPVTRADVMASEFICNALQKLTPDIPILSEERVVDWSTRRLWQRYWLVDPVDGTKEFIQRTDEFTVNIALIDQGFPVIGVIYVPVTEVLYFANWQSRSQGEAWKEWAGNRQRIYCQEAETPVVVSSRSHRNNKRLVEFLHSLGKYKNQLVGSSLKFCLIAEGHAQYYPRFGQTSIWDTAAGHSIVCAAGGKVVDWTGKELDYSPRPSLINPEFCVTAK